MAIGKVSVGEQLTKNYIKNILVASEIMRRYLWKWLVSLAGSAS